MARLFDDGSSEYLGRGDVLGFSDWPITIACLFNSDAALNQSLITIGDLDAANDIELRVRDPADSDIIMYIEDSGGGLEFAGTSASWSTNTLHHACGIVASDTSRSVYLDGGNKGTDTDNIGWPAGLDNTTIGATRYASGITQHMSGSISEVGIWNVALTDAEVAKLATGITAWQIRPQNIVSYWRLIRGLNDAAGGFILTANGTVVSPHPPITEEGSTRGVWAISAGAALFASIADTVGITDTINTSRNLKIALADSTGIADTITTSKGAVRSIADSVGISDVLSKIGTFIKSIADSVGITDTITTSKGAVRSIDDTVGITDVLSKIGTYIRNIADSVGITDVVAKIGTYKRSVADTTGITDTLTGSKVTFRSLADSVGITDTISTVLGKITSITDTLGITDTITTIVTEVISAFVDTISGLSRIVKSISVDSGMTKNQSKKSEINKNITGDSEL